MKIRYFVACLGVASVVLLGAVGKAIAADEWFVLSEKVLKTADPSVEITSWGDRRDKDIKQVKFSAEGADIEIAKAVLSWDNRPDAELTDLGVLKSGGESAPIDAPLRKARLESVTVQYKIVGDAPIATLKVWGFD
jgi:hypothetical protein